MIEDKLKRVIESGIKEIKQRSKIANLLDTRDFNESQMDQLDQRKKDLIPILGAGHPDVQVLDSRINRYSHENYLINEQLGLFKNDNS